MRLINRVLAAVLSVALIVIGAIVVIEGRQPLVQFQTGDRALDLLVGVG